VLILFGAGCAKFEQQRVTLSLATTLLNSARPFTAADKSGIDLESYVKDTIVGKLKAEPPE
jgi:hypothetical protein